MLGGSGPAGAAAAPRCAARRTIGNADAPPATNRNARRFIMRVSVSRREGAARKARDVLSPAPSPDDRYADLVVPGGCRVGVPRVVAAAQRELWRQAESGGRLDHFHLRAPAREDADARGGRRCA